YLVRSLRVREVVVGSHDGRVLVVLIGSGAGTSLTPSLHEREGDELGLRYLYRLRDLAALGLPPTAVGDVLAAVRPAGFDGGRMTVFQAVESFRLFTGLEPD